MLKLIAKAWEFESVTVADPKQSADIVYDPVRVTGLLMAPLITPVAFTVRLLCPSNCNNPAPFAAPFTEVEFRPYPCALNVYTPLRVDAEQVVAWGWMTPLPA
jgi:hypothetical protein